MSFRGRGDSSGNPNKMDLGDSRRFGDDEKPREGSEERMSRFDSARGRRPPFGRGRPSPSRDKPFGDRPREFGFGRGDDLMRDRSPIHRPDDRFSDRFKKDDGFPKRDDLMKKDLGRPFYGDDSLRDRFMDRPRPEDGRGNFNSRFDGPPGMQYRPRPAGPVNYPNSPHRAPFSEGFPKPNECEIIVVNKMQRAYAESVEDRIKAAGILVDILFLKDEALLTQTIDDIARRGSLYAMVINTQNETHRSVTVNILHGTPQEHRNMPLEDALKLLSRNFHEHIRSQKERMERERTERGPYVGGVSADHEVQFLLRMLADGRWISQQEIDIVIRYLSERRDKMQGAGDDRGQGRMALPSADTKIDPAFKPKDDVTQKEQDLQNKIMNIMNQGAPAVPPAGGIGSSISKSGGIPGLDIPSPRQNAPSAGSPLSQTGMKPGRSGLADNNAPDPQGLDSTAKLKDPSTQTPFSTSGTTAPLTSNTSSHPTTYINFDNQIVQKALDNLIQSGPNLLKNISLSTSGMTNTLSNQPPAAQTNTDNTRMNMSSSESFDHRGNMARGGPDVSLPPPRLPGNMGMGARGGSNLSDAGPGEMSRGPGDMGRSMNMSETGSAGGPRGMSMPGMGGGMGPNRGGYGSGMDSMNTNRGFGSGGDMGKMGPRSGLGPSQGLDQGPMQGMGGSNFSNQNMGKMGMRSGLGLSQGLDSGPMQNMSGGSFPNQNQFNKFQGPPGHMGNYPNSYNSGPSKGGMHSYYTGPQGMGGGPRRY